MANENETLQLYWGMDQYYENELKKLQEDKISEHNKELIYKFHKHLFKKGCGKSRVAKLSAQVRRLCVLVENKQLDTLTKDDIEDLVMKINLTQNYKQKKRNSKGWCETTRTYSEETKKDYRRVTKQFFKFLGKKDLVEEIKVSGTKKVYRCKDLITEEEIRKVVSTINNVRDRAFLMLLFESGARIGEFLNMRLKDVMFTSKNGDIWRIRLYGKTGERIVPVLVSIPYLTKYLETHPFRNNPQGYLWMGENNRYRHQPVGYVGANKIVERAFKTAGLEDKKINLHNFRHSSCSINAQKLTESQLCLYYGWQVGSSQMVKVYVHSSGRDLDKAFMSMHGLRTPEQEESINKPKTCICTYINEATAQFCTRCGKPLDLKTAIDSEERVTKATDQLFQLFGQIAQNPELMKQFTEFQKKFEK